MVLLLIFLIRGIKLEKILDQRIKLEKRLNLNATDDANIFFSNFISNENLF